jgi:hypothetical protein
MQTATQPTVNTEEYIVFIKDRIESLRKCELWKWVTVYEGLLVKYQRLLEKERLLKELQINEL